MALRMREGYHVYLCLTVDGAAPAFARELMLHELAHVWIWQNLTQQTQRELMARMALPTWDAYDVPWERRGIENAAAVIAWGLGEEPQSQILAGRSCTELAETFGLLTGGASLRPPCPSAE